MATSKQTVTLVPATKKKSNGNKATLTAAPIAKSPLDTFKASGIGDRMRKQYGATFYADPITKTGDAVTTLSDEYLMRIYDEQRATNPSANDERMWTENGEGNGVGLLVAAMAQAEADPQQQEHEASAINIPASNVRSSAHDAASVLSLDETYGAIQGAIIDAERTRKQAPAELAWTLQRLYVRYGAEQTDARGNKTRPVLCNMIEGTGPEFDDSKHYPWPVIGTEEKDKQGNTVNNPDLMKKYIGNKLQSVSFYGEVIRDTPRGSSLTERRDNYLLAAAKVPTGPFSDRNSPDYLDQLTADKKAEECKSDIDTMVKSIKRAVGILRHMWVFNEMAAPNSPPRCVASFCVEKKWDPSYVSPEGHKGQWIDDTSKLARLDSPILLTDKLGQEPPTTMRVGEFLSHDPIVAGLAGGTLSDFRKAVSKQKRKPGSGTGKTPEAQKAERTVLNNADLDTYISAVATSFETPAARGNYWQFLNGKPEDTDSSLQSTFNIGIMIMAGFASQPDLRRRLAELRHTTLSAINEQVGLDAVAGASAEINKAKVKIA